MDKTTVQKLKDAIAKANTIGVAVPHEPSVDEMGAALALYLLLKNAGKKVSIASPSDPIVEIANLVGIDKVQRHFGGDAGDLVVSFPYQEGEIEKVSYTLENNFLNIIVKASEQGLSFDEKDVQYTRGSGSIDLLIAVGAQQISDLGDVLDSQQLKNVTIINIDNKPNNQGYGDVVLVASDASSVSEHVGDIALTLGFSLEQDAAQNLLSGVMTATKNFQDPKTSSLAFEIAAFLMKRGARRIDAQPQRQEQRSEQHPQQQQQPKAQQNQPRPQPQNDRVRSEENRPAPQQQPKAQAQPQPQAQPAPRQEQRPQPQVQSTAPAQDEDIKEDAPPLDWLTPKVYKGSSEV